MTPTQFKRFVNEVAKDKIKLFHSGLAFSIVWTDTADNWQNVGMGQIEDMAFIGTKILTDAFIYGGGTDIEAYAESVRKNIIEMCSRNKDKQT